MEKEFQNESEKGRNLDMKALLQRTRIRDNKALGIWVEKMHLCIHIWI